MLQHGYHGLNALGDMLLYEFRQELWQDYTATALSMIGQLFCKQWPMPSFRDITDFDAAKRKADSRTGKQIAKDILKRFGG